MRDQASLQESLLARLFVDADFRARFERDPQAVGREFGLDEQAIVGWGNLDLVGLQLAARSYARKRSHRS